VSAYNADAHRFLAEHQLAPALHYAGTEDADKRMYGGRYMIVMDFIDATHPWPGSLSDEQFDQVRQAVDILHSHELVFGDLRTPNILITAETRKVMIIGFNWCKRADEGRYPISLNQVGIDWAEGVGSGCVMAKQHDLDMLNKLR
jgi:tRNA A-37 threonylcarbamoyl transferase component Bud32